MKMQNLSKFSLKWYKISGWGSEENVLVLCEGIYLVYTIYSCRNLNRIFPSFY